MEEALFMPCNRMHNLLLARFDLSPDAIDEILIDISQVDLRAGLSAEDILHRGYTWVDLWRLACSNIFVWMGPDTVIGADSDLDGNDRLLVKLGYEEVLVVRVLNRPICVQSRPSAIVPTAAVCEPLLRLLTENQESYKFITEMTFQYGPPVSSLTLSELLKRCTDTSRIEFGKLCILTSEHLRAILADRSPARRRTMLLDWDAFSGVDPRIVADFLRNCPWKIYLRCGRLGIRPLSYMLVGETSVQLLRLYSETGNEDSCSEDLSCLFRALAKNRNLVSLDLWFIAISDANWSILCHSLTKHPTLRKLGLERTMPIDADRIERKTRRSKEFLEMLKENTALETLNFGHGECDYRILSVIIRPYIWYRPLFSSLTKSSDPAVPQLLAQALRRVSDNPELLAMILLNNTEIVRLSLLRDRKLQIFREG
jgi:hypothetical protein